MLTSLSFPHNIIWTWQMTSIHFIWNAFVCKGQCTNALDHARFCQTCSCCILQHKVLLCTLKRPDLKAHINGQQLCATITPIHWHGSSWMHATTLMSKPSWHVLHLAAQGPCNTIIWVACICPCSRTYGYITMYDTIACATANHHCIYLHQIWFFLARCWQNGAKT